MSALDSCEPEVIRALEKDGWGIDQKPFVIRTDLHNVLADFSLRRNVDIPTEHIIILEVKCFSNPDNDLQEFYTAMGQYQFYRYALLLEGVRWSIYLAVPHVAYQRLVEDDAMVATFEQLSVNLVTIDLEREVVIQWID